MSKWKVSPRELRIRRVHLALWTYLAAGLVVLASLGWQPAFAVWLVWAGGTAALAATYWEDLRCTALGRSRDDTGQLMGLILLILLWPLMLAIATAMRIGRRNRC